VTRHPRCVGREAERVTACRRGGTTRAEGFPDPVAVLSAGLIWRRADVEAWVRATGRLA